MTISQASPFPNSLHLSPQETTKQVVNHYNESVTNLSDLYHSDNDFHAARKLTETSALAIFCRTNFWFPDFHFVKSLGLPRAVLT